MMNLEYYLHDETDALRIVVGLTAVAEADGGGRSLLLHWHRLGARIIARSKDSRTLAENIF